MYANYCTLGSFIILTGEVALPVDSPGKLVGAKVDEVLEARRSL